jgi:hypothetical protein
VLYDVPLSSVITLCPLLEYKLWWAHVEGENHCKETVEQTGYSQNLRNLPRIILRTPQDHGRLWNVLWKRSGLICKELVPTECLAPLVTGSELETGSSGASGTSQGPLCGLASLTVISDLD